MSSKQPLLATGPDNIAGDITNITFVCNNILALIELYLSSDKF